MEVILTFLVIHWFGSLFFQTFFLHRYSSHGLIKMGPINEKISYFLTFIFQGPSFLNPQAYAIMHQAHHAYSDGPLDPHSPKQNPSLFKMMFKTYKTYLSILQKNHPFCDKFKPYVSEWKVLNTFAESWLTRIAWGILYFYIYKIYSPHPIFFTLLIFHFFMGPIHGAIVNWCGHKYGYKNFLGKDESTNTLKKDFLMMGELFQNNHHHRPKSLNFAYNKTEIDPTYWILKFLESLNFLQLVDKPPKGKSLRNNLS